MKVVQKKDYDEIFLFSAQYSQLQDESFWRRITGDGVPLSIFEYQSEVKVERQLHQNNHSRGVFPRPTKATAFDRQSEASISFAPGAEKFARRVQGRGNRVIPYKE